MSLLLLVTPHPSQEVFIYRALLSDNNRFSLPCWDLQEVGLLSPEVLYTYKVNCNHLKLSFLQHLGLDLVAWSLKLLVVIRLSNIPAVSTARLELNTCYYVLLLTNFM